MIDSTLLCYISGWVVTYLSRWTAINICQALCPCEKKEHPLTCFFNVELNLSNKSVLSALTLFMLFSLSVYNYIPIFYQGGRTWQPFAGGKDGPENFRQAHIYNFCDKCVVFARLQSQICKFNSVKYAIYTM